MVEKEQLNRLIHSLLRGYPIGFNDCQVIQEGISYKRRIPKSFWFDIEKGFYGILGLHNLTKGDLKKIHSEVVERIIQEIKNPKELMYSDNYSRLFHGLSILGVSKCDPRVPAIGKNYMYNIAYDLWALDDGTSNTYEYISAVAWYAAEAFKENSFESEDLLLGRRHNSL